MMEDFSGLALPPLFGGHILEAELEPAGVELGPGEVELGPGDSEVLDGVVHEDEEKRALDKRKYIALNKRCKDIEQINQKILGRLHQVQRLLRRMRKERRFLMKTLDTHGDDYRNSHLTIHLEDESSVPLESAAALEADRINGVPGSSGATHHGAGPKKRRHRIPKQEKDKDPQTEPDIPTLTESPFGEIPSPTPLSH
ncbi:TCF3 fusion partner [Merluccius polli]|uniref:TCF3 fusion partner n=1 Tax=Merluccius polli TaxID=89951 RepID=A0AA47MF36_MERPO|nr:TCF3 fusion partner [Merluccius polli]